MIKLQNITFVKLKMFIDIDQVLLHCITGVFSHSTRYKEGDIEGER